MTIEIHEVQRPGQRVSRYEAPAGLDEALELLAAEPGRARAVAGGTDLLVELDRGARPGVDVLVDLGRVPGLARIERRRAGGTDTVHLGPLVTHNQVVASADCVDAALPLAQACWEVGSPQLRNRATVVGNLVTASPANDTISALLALDATLTLASTRGRREVGVGDFFTGFRSTVLEPDELVVDVAVPALTGDRRGVFVKLGLRRAQAISVVHLAAVVGLDAEGVVTEARVALGSVAPTVVLAEAAADALVGRPLDAGPIAEAARAARSAAAPIDDIRAGAAYRSTTLEVMVRRALEALAQGTQADRWPAEPTLLWPTGGDGTYPVAPRAPAVRALTDADPVRATVNGRPVTASGAAGATLLDWLRDEVGLTGTKEGCAEGECGACTVELDGYSVMACLVPAGRAQGATITTVEGLGSPDALTPVQQAYVDSAAVQCGYCIPGFVMSSTKLLEEHPHPTREQIEVALSGNLCRCTGYYAIIEAVEAAAGREVEHG